MKNETVLVATCTNRGNGGAHKYSMLRVKVRGNPVECPYCKHALFYERVLVKEKQK